MNRVKSNYWLACVVGFASAIVISQALPAWTQTTPTQPNAPMNSPTNSPSSPTTPNRPGVTPTRPTPIPQSTPHSTPHSTPQSTPQSTPGNMPAPNAAVTPLDREFVRMAAESNNFEIQLSQAALEQSTNADVQAYAQRMIEEHTLANRQLATLASEQGMPLPSGMGALNQAIMEQVSQLDGTAFDQAYMNAQVNSHMKAIALFRTEIQQGRDQGLVSFANQQLPLIREHYEMASQMTATQRAQDQRRPVQ